MDSKYTIIPTRGRRFSLWKTMNIDDSRKNVLVIMFALFGASQRIMAKYCDNYLSRGWPALVVPGSASHLLWPRSSIRHGQALVEYLNQEAAEYSHYIIHAISLGSYNFAVFTFDCLFNNSDKYGHIKSKIKAVIYDSIGFAIGNSDSLMQGVFNLMGLLVFNNSYFQRLFPKLMMVYIYFMQNYTSVRFEYLAQTLQTMPLEVPTLFFYCENDPITNYKDIRELVTGYRRIGSFPVLDKCWCDSRHAAHLTVHTNEYLEHIHRLLLLAIPGICDHPKPKSKL